MKIMVLKGQIIANISVILRVTSISEWSVNSEKLKKLNPNYFSLSYFFNFFRFILPAEICAFGRFTEGQFVPKILVSEKNSFTQKF